MKIAILTSGIMPVPAVQGGAVENLIDFYLGYNDQCHLHDITIYSIWHPDVRTHFALTSKVNHYHYIQQEGYWSKANKYLYQKKHQVEYYHYSIEYFFEQAYKKIQKVHYDLIIVENRPGFALKLKQRLNTPCILHLHNDFLNNETLKAKDIYDGYRQIICVSDFISKRVQNIAPKTQRKCETVYNAINLIEFEKASPFKRDQFNLLSDSDFIIVYSGRITEEKGILQLIQAIKQIKGIPNLKLMIIGASAYGKDMQPTPFIQRLEEETESIKDNVLYTGFVDYNKIPSYLKMADIAVVPSMWEEPFGLTVVEAMAAGLPLITTRSGGIPEICEGVATIVDRDNIVDNLAAAILDLYQHPKKRAAMAKASLERSKLFDKETYAKNFFAALENI